MELGVQGKVAIITGGSDGIGKAAAQILAAEGAKVAICARTADALDAAAADIRGATGGTVLAVPADVTKPETWTGWSRRYRPSSARRRCLRTTPAPRLPARSPRSPTNAGRMTWTSS